MYYFVKSNFLKIYLFFCFLVSSNAQNAQFITGLNVANANLTSMELSRWQHFSSMSNTNQLVWCKSGL
jgi:hypothetical protein